MSDLYGCHFAVTTKKAWLAGLNRTGGFGYTMCLSRMANEAGGLWTPGSPVLIYSDEEEEDLKQRESHGQDISGRFLP